MKILKEKAREYNGKSYYKYKVNLPERVIKGAELKDGDELEAEVGKKKIILKKK